MTKILMSCAVLAGLTVLPLSAQNAPGEYSGFGGADAVAGTQNTGNRPNAGQGFGANRPQGGQFGAQGGNRPQGGFGGFGGNRPQGGQFGAQGGNRPQGGFGGMGGFGANRPQGANAQRPRQQAQPGTLPADPPTTEKKDYVPTGNPIFKHKFTADPAPVVIGDTLWLLTSHDAKLASGQQNSFYDMRDWCLFSTKDMKTWTEHPTPMKLTDYKWDSSHNAYAAQMCERDGKYYMYCATNGSGIGVGVADKPEGPYKDAIGKQLITPEMCFATSHSWAAIDPSVLIDDDGQAYLVWGNGACYYAKLKKNMIELDGEVKLVDCDWKNTRFVEGPWIHKYNGKYYLTYSAGGSRIGYAMADKMEGHFESKGVMCEGTRNSGTNHPGIACFKGQWYFFHHDGTLPGGGSFNRSVRVEKMEYNADGTIKPIVLNDKGIWGDSVAANSPTEFKSQGNPIFRDVWTCDPAALVVGDTVYVYTGHDDAADGQMFNITAWRCYSSKDLVNWKSHGDLLTSGDFKYGLKNTSWAAQVVEKNGKFYWYVTTRDDTHGGNSISVAVADSPTGPFKPVDEPIITDGLTKGFMGWNDIDPTVLIDSDGTAWLCWGNGNCYLCKLKPNMIERDGEIIDLKMQSYEEGPWLYKRGKTYYCIYASRVYGDEANHKNPRGSEVIAYATADKITGPWTYRGQITGSAKNSFTIHPAVIDFKGRTFMFYHSAVLTLNGKGGALGRRCVCLDELFFNEDGSIKPMQQTDTAIKEPVK